MNKKIDEEVFQGIECIKKLLESEGMSLSDMEIWEVVDNVYRERLYNLIKNQSHVFSMSKLKKVRDYFLSQTLQENSNCTKLTSSKKR